jgi:hypothetical protein
VIPKLPEGILLPDVSDAVSNALNSGSPLPVDFNTAAGVTAGATQVTVQAYLVEDLGFSIGGYKGVLSDANWLLLADTGALGPLVYYWNNFTLVVAGLESSQMAELGEQRGPGVVVALYDPS